MKDYNDRGYFSEQFISVYLNNLLNNVEITEFV